MITSHQLPLTDLAQAADCQDPRHRRVSVPMRNSSEEGRVCRGAGSPRALGTGLWGTAAIVAVCMAGSACQPDTRMSMEQFLAMQQQQQETGAPGFPSVEGLTTQPTSMPASQPALEPWATGPYRVGPGDVLTIAISGLDKLGLPASCTPRVTEKGEVILPSVGAVPVDGMTLDEVEAAILAKYSPQYIKDTQVSAQIIEYKPISVMVFGDIFRSSLGGDQQSIELRRNKASVLQAMLVAGGPIDFGGRVTLIPARYPDQTVTFELGRREDLVRAARIGSIQDDDILIVDGRPNNVVYVQGLVNSPGPIPMARSATLSVLQAIGAAGGTLLAFEPREATLMRRKPDGELTRVKVDLDRIKLGKTPDIALAAGDVLIVPHNVATRVEEYIARAFTLRIGTGVETTYNPWTEYYMKRSNEISGNGNGGFFSSFYSQLTNQLGQLGVVTQPQAPTGP